MKQLKRFENGNYSFKKWANNFFKFEIYIFDDFIFLPKIEKKKLMILFAFPKLKKIKLLDHLVDNCHRN
jgi:hypothetical protein